MAFFVCQETAAFYSFFNQFKNNGVKKDNNKTSGGLI